MKLSQAIAVISNRLNQPISPPNSDGIYEMVIDEVLNVSCWPLKSDQFILCGEILKKKSNERFEQAFFKELLQLNFQQIEHHSSVLTFDKRKNTLLLYQIIYQERLKNEDEIITQFEKFLNSLEFWRQFAYSNKDQNVFASNSFITP